MSKLNILNLKRSYERSITPTMDDAPIDKSKSISDQIIVKKWKKIIINKSNRITKINKIKNFKYFCEEDSENYGNIDAGYDSNRYYQNKELFFEFSNFRIFKFLGTRSPSGNK